MELNLVCLCFKFLVGLKSIFYRPNEIVPVFFSYTNKGECKPFYFIHVRLDPMYRVYIIWSIDVKSELA